MPTWKTFAHALAGIRILVATQTNARIHLAVTAAVALTGWSLEISRADWCWIVVAVTMVWAAEALNTAVEILGDVASAGARNPLVGRAKDVAAAAVLFAAMGAALIGVIILLPAFSATTFGARFR